jgi:hypothetical protein
MAIGEKKVSDLSLASEAQVSNAFDLLVTGRAPTENGDMAPKLLRISLNDEESPILKSRVFKKFKDTILSEVDTLLSYKVDKVSGKELSSNNFTSVHKNMLDNPQNYFIIEVDQEIFGLSSGALSVNDAGIPPSKISTSDEFQFVSSDDKVRWDSKMNKVNFTNGVRLVGSTVQLDTSLAATREFVLANSGKLYKFKGTCLFEELPASGAEVGDAYYVSDKDYNYAWNGESWNELGTTVNTSDFMKTSEARSEFVLVNSFNDLSNTSVKTFGDQVIEGKKSFSNINLSGVVQVGGTNVEIPTDKGRLAGIEDIKVSSVNGEVGDVVLTTDNVTVGIKGNLYVTKPEKDAWSAKQDALSREQLLATFSGITAEKVQQISELKNALSFKQDLITGVKHLALISGITTNKVSAYDAHIADQGIHVTSEEKAYIAEVPNKQDALTEDQLAAVNSGATESKVKLYDEVAVKVDKKQDKLSSEQLAAVDSGITSDKVKNYDRVVVDIDDKQNKITPLTNITLYNLMSTSTINVGGTIDNPHTSITSNPGYTVFRMLGMDGNHYQMFVDQVGNLHIARERNN